MSAVTLTNDVVTAEIRPNEGGRVASLRDLRSGRELLFRARPQSTDRVDYMACYAGGWEEMFPNDSPWEAYPFHGMLWNAGFRVTDLSARRVTLRTELSRPNVECRYRFELLDPPCRGLRLTIELTPRSPTGPCLWTSHPALAVRPGWQIRIQPSSIDADSEWPGRFSPGPLGTGDYPRALTVPDSARPLAEVLYAHGVSQAEVFSRDHHAGTRVTWDTSFLTELWITTIARADPIDLAVLIEPSTSVPFRLGEALANGSARQHTAGERITWWIALESLDWL